MTTNNTQDTSVNTNPETPNTKEIRQNKADFQEKVSKIRKPKPVMPTGRKRATPEESLRAHNQRMKMIKEEDLKEFLEHCLEVVKNRIHTSEVIKEYSIVLELIEFYENNRKDWAKYVLNYISTLFILGVSLWDFQRK